MPWPAPDGVLPLLHRPRRNPKGQLRRVCRKGLGQEESDLLYRIHPPLHEADLSNDCMIGWKGDSLQMGPAERSGLAYRVSSPRTVQTLSQHPRAPHLRLAPATQSGI